ncbi:MAG: class E sortase, partial [Ilumatobacteraceae bacterium]
TSTTTPTPSTSTTTSTTTTAAPLPLQATSPIAPPSDPNGAEPLVQVGSISIPSIGLDAPMYEGIRLTTLNHGPGHWPGSAAAGHVGNAVVAGHRTSHNAEFRRLDRLVPGDIVTFTTSDGVFDYSVVGTEIVGPDALWIVDPSDTPTATLFACHPPGSTRQRIVVTLALLQPAV